MTVSLRRLICDTIILQLYECCLLDLASDDTANQDVAAGRRQSEALSDIRSAACVIVLRVAIYAEHFSAKKGRACMLLSPRLIARLCRAKAQPRKGADNCQGRPSLRDIH